jgi:hypothetical protein
LSPLAYARVFTENGIFQENLAQKSAIFGILLQEAQAVFNVGKELWEISATPDKAVGRVVP